MTSKTFATLHHTTSMDNVQTTNVSNNKPAAFKKKVTSTYDTLVILKRELYYKSIVLAHEADITEKTELEIKEILYCFKRHWISASEVFSQLGKLRSGYNCTDLPVKLAIRALRANRPTKSLKPAQAKAK